MARKMKNQITPKQAKALSIFFLITGIIILLSGILLAFVGVGGIFVIIGIIMLVASRKFKKIAKAASPAPAPKSAPATPPPAPTLDLPAANEPIKKSKANSFPAQIDDYILKYNYNDVEIAGVSYRNIDFSQVKLSGVDFIFEPDNEHDKNAIKIMQNNLHLGYVRKGQHNDMIHDFKKLDRGVVVGSISDIDEANQVLKYHLGFYTQISEATNELVFSKAAKLTKTASRQDAFYSLSKDDSVTLEEQYDSDNLLVLSDMGEELGELPAKISEQVSEYIAADEYICTAKINEIIETDSGKYNASIQIEVYKK